MKFRQMTRFFALCIALVAFLAVFATGTTDGQTLLRASARELDRESTDSKVTPVTKVVNLLTEMKTTIELEMKDDKKTYAEMECWCHNHVYELQSAIEDHVRRIRRWQSQLNMLTIRSGKYASSLEALFGTLAGSNSTLGQAQALREKEAYEFHEFEKFSITSIEQLKAAIIVISRHTAEGSIVGLPQLGFSFLERMSVSHKSKRDDPDTGMESDAESELGDLVDSMDTSRSSEPVLSQAAPSSQAAPTSQPHAGRGQFLEKRSLVEAKPVAPHLDQPSGWTDSEVATVKQALRIGTSLMQSTHREPWTPKYKGQSHELVGFLKQKQVNMEDALAEAQKKEKRAIYLFGKVKYFKLQEIEVAEAIEAEQSAEKLQTDNELSWTEIDLLDAQATMKMDQETLATVNKKCSEEEAAYIQRKAERGDELAAVSQAIDILTGDDARDSFNDAYGSQLGRKTPSFLQLSSEEREHQALSQKALSFLRREAVRTHSPQLALLSVPQETLRKFDIIKVEIDKMIYTLKYQQDEEVKKNDWCKKEIQKNSMKILKLTDEKKDYETAVAALEQKIKTLEDEISSEKQNIDDLTKALKEATDMRVAEKTRYKELSTNQRITKEVLEKAVQRLNEFYATRASLLQGAPPADPSSFTTPVFTTPQPPVVIKKPAPQQMTYKPNEQSVTVTKLIEKLIAEISQEIADYDAQEAAAQKDYDEFKTATTDAIADSKQSIIRKTRERAEEMKEKIEISEDLAVTSNELSEVTEYQSTTKQSCDYNLRNFEMRRKKRAEEIESLQRAIHILSGAKFDADEA